MDAHHHDLVEEPDAADPMAEMLDLDAEVLHAYLSDAIAWVRHLAGDRPRHQIVDLGSGTGNATIALGQVFPDARVLAVDSSAELLDRVSTKARTLGMTDRIVTLQADLDSPWPDVGPVDVVWASLSLHHLADPDRVLADVFANARPGGLIVIAEMDAMPHFLPDDIGLGRPGLEARCYAALADTHARELPHLGADWGQRLSHAGFTAVAKRTFIIDLDHPLPPATGRYARAFLWRLRTHLDSALTTDDKATLDALIDTEGPHSVLHRQDLVVRGTRTIWAGTRP